MPTAGTGQLTAPHDIICSYFADSATFAAAVAARPDPEFVGTETAADRVYAIDKEDYFRPFVILYEGSKSGINQTLGAFGQVEFEGKIEYPIADADIEAGGEREAWTKFQNDISAIIDEVDALNAANPDGQLINLIIELDGIDTRSDPLREGEEQAYLASFRIKCGLEG